MPPRWHFCDLCDLSLPALSLDDLDEEIRSGVLVAMAMVNL